MLWIRILIIIDVHKVINLIKIRADVSWRE